MLRSAVAAGTPVGLQRQRLMARGELVPDEIVVGIVSDRIDEPDARNGFMLDGFPRTVAQAEALDRLLADKGLKLDAVIQLRVDEGILLKRIEKRVAEMKARGESLRDDDNPQSFKIRLDAYRDQTAPLVTYYRIRACCGRSTAWPRSAASRSDRPGAGDRRRRARKPRSGARKRFTQAARPTRPDQPRRTSAGRGGEEGRPEAPSQGTARPPRRPAGRHAGGKPVRIKHCEQRLTEGR